MRRCGAVVLIGALACGTNAPAPAPGALGPDCLALSQAAKRAAACDRALGDLAAALGRDHDETRCRSAARRLLARPAAPEARVRSTYPPGDPDADEPLREDERERLSALVLPAQVLVQPDLRPGPGVPQTSASVLGQSLDPDEHGRLQAYLVPGRHTLELRHAGEQTTYCVDVDACDRLTLTAHGRRLAAHPRATLGGCHDDTLTPAPAVAQATRDD